jgi:glycosyltransferase involved in cell wall biosynthesis
MRVLFAIKSLNTRGGGAERVLAALVDGLSRRGHDILVLTFDGPGQPFYPLSPEVERVDLRVGQVGEPLPRRELLAVMPHLRHAVGSAQPDVVVGFMHSMFVPLSVALAGTGLPVVASEHVGMDHYRTVPAQRVLLELVPWLTAASTVPSERVAAAFPPRLRKRMVVIPNPVAPSAEAAAVPKGSRGRIILAVGRLFPEKNHAVLLEAFSRVAGEFPDWRLRVVGEGPLRPDLEALAVAGGFGSRIELPGATNAIASEYSSADIVVVPSLHESFGLVTAEALAAGRPVIGFADCPGTNELIEDGINGLLVPGDGDRVSALVDGLRQLMMDTDLRTRLGLAGPDSVAEFGVDAVIDRWERLLLGCVGRTRRRHGG